jgi:hypothetical protein
MNKHGFFIALSVLAPLSSVAASYRERATRQPDRVRDRKKIY